MLVRNPRRPGQGRIEPTPARCSRVGDDGRDGRSAEASGAGGPFRTIARALRAAGAGDRIILTKTTEPYRESITLQGGRHSGHENRYESFQRTSDHHFL